MKPRTYLSLAFFLCLSLSLARAADVRQGLVSYWPLDTTDGATTPDVSSFGHHLSLLNMDASHFVAGKRGKAASFNGTDQLLSRIYAAGEDNGLPISGAIRYTVALWVNGVGADQGDRRVFSEGSDSSNTPLFNIGTDSAAAATRTNVVDIFIRNDANAALVNHIKSRGMAFDGTWHHIAWVEENGAGQLYIDGQLDATVFRYARSPLTLNTISVGGIQRAAAGSFFSGLIDDVAIWERPLTQAEIQQVMADGISTPIPASAPLIVSQPEGSKDLLVGDSYTLAAQAAGARPLTYEWRKNNTAIAGANSATLTLSGLRQTDSGDYSVAVRNSAGSVTSQPATLLVSPPPPPNLPNGMVSYWPLDEVQGSKTPDVVSGYDMELQNLTAADLANGKWGKAFKFDNARQTMMERVHLPADQLPIYKHPNFTVSLWVNGPPNLQDLRVYSEASTTVNTPLFNIGTHNTAANGAVDIYVRNDANQQGGHKFSIIEGYDNTWRHVVYVQREVGGVMQAALYIDGVKDEVALDPRRPMTVNTTSIGGIRRAARSFWFTGMIDDVAVWKRALSAEEIVKLFKEGTPTPGAIAQPLAIRSFKADLPAVGKGDSVTLRWDLSKDATQIEIDQGVGDVLPKTVVGLGSITVPISETKIFTLTVRRGTDVLSAKATVAAIDGVGANWALLDNFDTYNTGAFPSTWWGDLGGNSQIADVKGNRMLNLRGTGRIALLPLNEWTVKEGQQRTLFARLYVQGDPAEAVRNLVGLTDRPLRFVTDATDEGGVGPAAFPSNEAGDLMIGARNGVSAAIDFLPPVLELEQVYNLWIDIRNDPVATGDTYSLYIQKQGDAARAQLFTGYISNRNPAGNPAAAGGGPTLPDLDKVFVGNNSVNSVFFDDLYISKSGFNTTVPRVFGATTPIGGQAPTLSITRSGTQVEIGWTQGTLESATSVTGPWTAVQGATAPSYKATPDGTARFYRVRR